MNKLLMIIFILILLNHIAQSSRATATNFGPPCDQTDYQQGNCHSIYILPDYHPSLKGFVAAPSDMLASLFQGPICQCSSPPTQPCGNYPFKGCTVPPACKNQGSCGKKLQVSCVSDIKGESKICNGKSVIVSITDACPHNHPQNCKKCSEEGFCWCQKSSPHIDLGCDAFLGITNWRDNIIIDYRFVNDDSEVGVIGQ